MNSKPITSSVRELFWQYASETAIGRFQILFLITDCHKCPIFYQSRYLRKFLRQLSVTVQVQFWTSAVILGVVGLGRPPMPSSSHQQLNLHSCLTQTRQMPPELSERAYVHDQFHYWLRKRLFVMAAA